MIINYLIKKPHTDIRPDTRKMVFFTTGIGIDTRKTPVFTTGITADTGKMMFFTTGKTGFGGVNAGGEKEPWPVRFPPHGRV
jgi:hypothetical protein